MAVERSGIDPVVTDLSGQIEVVPEKSRDQEIREAAEVLVTDEGIMTDTEVEEMEAKALSGDNFYENIAESMSKADLSNLARTS